MDISLLRSYYLAYQLQNLADPIPVDHIVNKVLFVGNIGELYSCPERTLISSKKILLKSYSYSYSRD